MSQYIWCVDLGGTKIQSALICIDEALNAEKNLLDLKTEAVYLSEGPQGLVGQLKRLYKSHKVEASIGVIASAGPLNSKTGELLNPTNLKTNNQSWGRFNIIEALKKELEFPLYLENDAAAAADGEFWLKGIKSFLVLTLGTGLGVAAYVDGQRVVGPGGLHPEVSHQSSHKEGKTYEQLLSAKVWKASLKKDYDNKSLARALQQRDKEIVDNLEVYINDLVKLVRNFYLSYMPERVVLAGGFAEFLRPVIDEVNKKLYSSTKDHHFLSTCPKVIVSEDYRHNGLYGAGYIGLNILQSKNN